jgi:hypothetical protein
MAPDNQVRFVERGDDDGFVFHFITSYSNATPSGSFSVNRVSAVASSTAGGSPPSAGPQSRANEIVPLAASRTLGLSLSAVACLTNLSASNRTSGAPGVKAGIRAWCNRFSKTACLGANARLNLTQSDT